ncbi:MAG: hypothetical protein ACK5O2_13580 [Microthrixaceae bacterium]
MPSDSPTSREPDQEPSSEQLPEASTGGGDSGPQPLGLSRPAALWAIFAVSLAGLLLEVSYTRVVSYKLWYYYTYLVIGLALLGLGSGATLVVLSPRLRSMGTASVLRVFALLGAIAVFVGYCVVAVMPIDTVALWDYGTSESFSNFGALAVICFALFVSFVPIGVMVSILLARAGSEVGRLYFADLIGAGLGCVVVVFLISGFGPPSVIMGAGALLAATGAVFAWNVKGILKPAALGACAVLVLFAALGENALPNLRTESSKVENEGQDFSGWGPVFRVDVKDFDELDDAKVLVHDGTAGSAIYRFDGDVESLTRFDDDPRAWPFATLGDPPSKQLIIGSAGGNEILASLYNGTEQIDAVELNPVTVGLLTGEFADYTGNLPEIDNVNLTQGDGRTYLARSDGGYDLVWFVAPDSYAANNAASSGAFVLSESYLYTKDMVLETLDKLSDDGVSVAQFGEVDFANSPNRTARYVVTARAALEEFGIEDPSQHLLVATSEDPFTSGLSTIMVSKAPFTPERIDRFVKSVESTTDSRVVYAPGVVDDGNPIADLAAAPDGEALEALVAQYPDDVSAITDDAPFFWHFTPFTDVVKDISRATTVDFREYAIGERVLLLLLVTSALFAVIFLLLPFMVIRRQWRELPAKGTSAVYFAALGLGFMLYEISMIQQLVLYLGYPSYSLTVTLASILVFTGIGALWSGRFSAEPTKVLPVLFGVLAVLTLLYRFALPSLIDGTLTAPFVVRAGLSFLLLAPLGLCLGMFMPFGLRTVGALSEHPDEYVAWGWAINGVFSVIGSVLTTILAMSWGFRTVQLLSLGMYLVAVLVLWRLDQRRRALGRPLDDPQSVLEVTDRETAPEVDLTGAEVARSAG